MTWKDELKKFAESDSKGFVRTSCLLLFSFSCIIIGFVKFPLLKTLYGIGQPAKIHPSFVTKLDNQHLQRKHSKKHSDTTKTGTLNKAKPTRDIPSWKGELFLFSFLSISGVLFLIGVILGFKNDHDANNDR